MLRQPQEEEQPQKGELQFLKKIVLLIFIFSGLAIVHRASL